MKSNKQVFSDIRADIMRAGVEAFRNATADAMDTVKRGYAEADVVRADDGSVLSKVDPKTIADTVTTKVSENGQSAIIYILGDKENDEATRQYALGNGADTVRNPFLAALFRLRSPERLAKITGLRTK